MKKSLSLIAVLVVLGWSTASMADTSSRYVAQLYSGYASNVQGADTVSVGGKVLVYLSDDLRLGGLLFYDNLMGNGGHLGGLAFVSDYVVPLASWVEFFVGTHLGICSGTGDPALYLEPGAGFQFKFGVVGLEWRIGARLPWMLGSALHLKSDTQLLTTLSVVFGRW